jgi:DNA-binding CsgD family transcriptional regulator
MKRVDTTRWIVQERADSAMSRTRAGETAREIAVRLGVSPRTVVRYRAREREMAGAR